MGSSSVYPVRQTTLFLAGGFAAVVAAAYFDYRRRCRILEDRSSNAEERRKEERTGRIRAEVKLRTLYKQIEALEMTAIENRSSSSTVGQTSTKIQDQHRMILQCSGTIVSPYTKRMGTPRQGSLVPSSRAFVDLFIPTEALDGMEDYSHIWIVFAFHANTNTFHKKTKVRPPRATGHQKVGQLATRSPHRPNPLGLSLVKMERLDRRCKRLHISGIDLVHGTPVYDIKPCVPWDVPGNFDSSNGKNGSNITGPVFQVPDWVDQRDSIESVQFTESAQSSLRELVEEENRLAPLYTTENDGLAAAQATLKEILAQDPRSSHKGLKVNRRGTSSAPDTSKNDNGSDKKMYSLVFGKLQVEFQVLSSGVQVEGIFPVDFDEDAYVEGIPLISEQKNVNT